MTLGTYIARRALFTILVLVAVSMISFVVIQLPPGDYVTTYINRMLEQGSAVDQATVAALRAEYGLDQPEYIQYAKWMKRIVLQGDFGRSFQFNRPVTSLLAERVPMTIMISLLAMLVSYGLAIPIGIYSATHQYSTGDFFFTAIAFVGMAVPGFLIALVLLWTGYLLTGRIEVGLFSMQFREAAWNWAKLQDMLGHLPIPLLVIGLSGTAGTTRVMRGVLLDELRKPYVVTGRAKGLTEWKLLMKYPVRVALNPIISGTAWLLPALISGSTIVEIVLDMPTVGPLLFQALMAQDMFLAGSCVLILSTLTVVGVVMADVLLAVTDPRIRFER